MTTHPEKDAREPRALVITLAFAVAGIAFLFATQQIYDPDTWWHLATGRWVVEHGRVPRADAFSFATAGTPWVAYSWLPATGMYLAHSLGGATALVLAKAALVASAFALAFLLAVRASIPPWLAALSLSAAVPIARFQFRERPQILMFLLVALFFWLLGEERAERRRWTWILLGIAQVAWANVHGSYILGIALTGALFTERLLLFALAALRREPERDGRGLALAGGLLALVVAASFATPFGARLVLQTFEDMTVLSVSRSFVNEEFQPLSPARLPWFVVQAAVTAVSFAVAGRRSRPYVVAAFLGFAVLAFGSVRFAAVAAFVFSFVLAVNLGPLAARLAARLTPPTVPGRLGASALLCALLALFTAVTFRGSFFAGREARFGVGVNESRFPGPAVRFLQRTGFTGNLFNSWVHGGYALWHLPGAKDLVDGRATPAQLALLDRLAELDRGGLERFLVEQDVRGALLTRDDPFVSLFTGSARYAQAFFDDRAVVFLRRDLAEASGSAAVGYRFLQPEQRDPSYLLPIARGPHAAEAEAELRGAVRTAPDTFLPRFLLGWFLEARGNPEALDHYLEAARLNPGLAFAHNDLGVRAGLVALSTGRIAQVEPILRQSLEVKKADPAVEALLGMSLQAQKRLPEAEASFRRALDRAPEFVLALTNLGYLYVDTGRPALAVPLFERARRLAPGDESAAYGLALALHAKGDRAAAASAWRAFLAGFPASTWAHRARQRLAECGQP